MRTDILLVLLGATLNVLAQVTLKASTRGMARMDLGMVVSHWRELALNPLILLACTLYAISVVNWVVVLSRVDLSLAYPLCTAIAFVLTFIAGILVFGEHLTMWRLAGAALIVMGAFLLCRPAAAS